MMLAGAADVADVADAADAADVADVADVADAADALMLLNQDQDLLADLSIAICSSFKTNYQITNQSGAQ